MIQQGAAVNQRQESAEEFKPLRIRALLASRWLSFNVMVLSVSLGLAV